MKNNVIPYVIIKDRLCTNLGPVSSKLGNVKWLTGDLQGDLKCDPQCDNHGDWQSYLKGDPKVNLQLYLL